MQYKQRFEFCPKCGGRLAVKFRRERKRAVCDKCGFVFYDNPVVGVAAIVLKGDRILLGRRARFSTYPGLWCIPCGFVEYDEDVREAARREFKEETGLVIEVEGVYTVHSNWHNPEQHTVGIWFNASVAGGELCPGDDIDEVGYFPLTAPPPLAFPTDALVVKQLLADLTASVNLVNRKV